VSIMKLFRRCPELSSAADNSTKCNVFSPVYRSTTGAH
jgi:hypothetical protein